MSFAFKYFRTTILRNNLQLFKQNTNNQKLILINYKSLYSINKKKFNERRQSPWKLLGYATALGVCLGSYYSYRKIQNARQVLLNSDTDEQCSILQQFPNVKISRKITYPNDTSGLKFTLFQYPTCPFCCKVRSFLDYNGISYNVVEVNPVLRQQLKWSNYKKVPILLVKVPEGYIQLNDSTMIISALSSHLRDKDIGLREVANYYPSIAYVDDDGNVRKEILNRYFVMKKDDLGPKDLIKAMNEERKWRQWADDVLVHTLSPNVYRTREEALQAFKWFSEVGHWKELFAIWEQYLVVYVGAYAMWLIGKRLKKRHNLKDDVRQSLYDECNYWLHEVRKSGNKFHGGVSPDLADLAVYGVLSSIEGCLAFEDLLQYTLIKTWYYDMKKAVENHRGM